MERPKDANLKASWISILKMKFGQWNFVPAIDDDNFVNQHFKIDLLQERTSWENSIVFKILKIWNAICVFNTPSVGIHIGVQLLFQFSALYKLGRITTLSLAEIHLNDEN
jgi:hypothetical protein